MGDHTKHNQPAGWNLPAPVQPGYPTQSQYPLQPGYIPQQAARNPPSPYPQSVPTVETIQAHMSNNDPEAAKIASPDNFGSSFSSVSIRHAFIRKVYILVSVQLLVSFGFVLLFSMHQGLRAFVQANTWVYILAYVVFLVTYITLVCCTGVRRKWPGNFIMLAIFTLAMSYMLGAISATYQTRIVIFSLGITIVICFLITLFAVQTKIDFTGFGIYLFIASMVIFIFGIMAIIMRNEIMSLLYSAGIVLLFSMYLIYDTQQLMGGRKHELSAEEHIYGALVLYIDVVMIFLGILGLSRYN